MNFSQRVLNWIEAFRLRTLFLALASVVTGGLLPILVGSFNLAVFIFTLLTTIALQVLSNLANDYGDFEKGTDNENRVGPVRSVQSGKISKNEMRWLIMVFVFLSLFFGITLLVISFPVSMLPVMLFFLLIGIGAIWAAIKYTMGKRAFGYYGLGDFFVFLFFGIVGVLGSFFLHTLKFNPQIILPSITIGFFAVGVLNLNNMRDIENDKRFGKNTIPVRMGLTKARYYHLFLVLGGWMTATAFSFLNFNSVISFGYFLTLPLFAVHLVKVYRREQEQLDPLLKELSLSIFLFSVVFVTSFVLPW